MIKHKKVRLTFCRPKLPQKGLIRGKRKTEVCISPTYLMSILSFRVQVFKSWICRWNGYFSTILRYCRLSIKDDFILFERNRPDTVNRTYRFISGKSKPCNCEIMTCFIRELFDYYVDHVNLKLKSANLSNTVHFLLRHNVRDGTEHTRGSTYNSQYSLKTKPCRTEQV
jgi:hypothetical protein